MATYKEEAQGWVGWGDGWEGPLQFLRAGGRNCGFTPQHDPVVVPGNRF